MKYSAHVILSLSGVPSAAVTAIQVGSAWGLLLAFVATLPLSLRETRLMLSDVLEHCERVAAREAGDTAAHRELCRRPTRRATRGPDPES